MLFFICLFLGVRTEALGAPVIDFALEHVSAGEAFHLFPLAPADLILGIVAQEKVGTDRIGNVHRVKPSFSAPVRHRIVAVRGMVHITITIVIFIVPIHQVLLLI